MKQGLSGTEPPPGCMTAAIGVGISCPLGKAIFGKGIFSREGSDDSDETVVKAIDKKGIKSSKTKNHALIRRLSRPNIKDPLRPRMPKDVYNQLIGFDANKERKKLMKAKTRHIAKVGGGIVAFDAHKQIILHFRLIQDRFGMDFISNSIDFSFLFILIFNVKTDYDQFQVRKG